ncbi:MAG: ketopantoate reductase C-terminal domain-containing protein [Alphaproteobacteria bacterium]
MKICIFGAGAVGGIDFTMPIEPRIDMAGAVGAHKTSMPRDLEHGRPLEIDAILGLVRELGELVDRPTPVIDMILALARRRGRAFTSR